MELFNEDFTKINKLIKQKISNPNFELEVRLCGNIFNNALNNIILDKSEFKRILQLLTFSKENNGLELSYENQKTLDINLNKNDRITINNLDEIKHYFIQNNLYDIKNYSYIKKDIINNLDILDYSLRVSLSNETKYDSMNNVNNVDLNSPKYYRYKNRYSIISEDKLFKYDLSETKSANAFNIKESNLFKQNCEYEIEIEYIGELKNSDEIFTHLMNNIGIILKLYQNNNYILSKSEYDLTKEYYTSITKTPKFIAANAVTLHQKNLVNNKKFINIHNNYAVTYKADGERYLGIVNTDSKLFLINNNYNILKTDIVNKNFIGSIIECEYIQSNQLVLVYDILYHKKKKCSDLKLIPNRTNLLINFVKDSIMGDNFSLNYKEHVSHSNIFESINNLLDNSKNLQYNTDGLIFTPINEAYPLNGGSWYSLFKWKPESLNSIDFLIKIVKNNHLDTILTEKVNDKFIKYKQCNLMVSGFREIYNNSIKKREKKCVPVEFKPFNEVVQIANIVLEDEKIYAYDELNNSKEIIEDDTIVEFRYDLYETNELFKWKPIRIRHDKTLKYKNGNTMFGNFETVANNIWKSIKHPVTETLIRNGNIDENNLPNENEEYYSSENYNSNPNDRLSYQKFHTIFIKTNLIKKTIELVSKSNIALFDIGFGKLGDLPNWKKNKIDYIFGVDNNLNNLDNALQIYKEEPSPKPKMLLCLGDFGKLIYPNFDCALDSDSKKIMKKNLFSKYQFDILSSQFSLTYFYKDEITLRTFFQNINDTLKINGYFIATAFDGESVINFLNKNKMKEGKLNNKLVWKIEKHYRNGTFDYEKPLYGKEISVFISSIGKTFRENLINFTYFKKLASEYKLELVEEYKFSDLFKEMSNNSNYKNISNTMTDVEKEFSFLNKQIIFRKKEHSSVKLFTKLQNKIKKQK